MIIALSTAAGIGSAVLVHSISQHVAHHNARQEHVRDLMYAQPLEQGDPSLASNVPPGVLPLDATPTPGSTPEPGSARPSIQVKPSFSIPFLPPIPGFNQPKTAKLVLVRTKDFVKDTKDPIWELQLKSGDQVLETLPALTGRAYRQTANRHVSGNKSPLPVGIYSIDRMGIEAGPFPDPELGKGFWVPITPLFNTGRSDLGFHQDPSWGKKNGESGTSGCIGLQKASDTLKLVEWIKHYNLTRLTVES